MATALKKSIEELVALYELEPTIRDVIVEGRDDVALVKWYLCQRTSKEFEVYDIDSIDVPTALVMHHRFHDGNVGRIRTLAIELDRALVEHARRCVKLVVDADFEIPWKCEW